MFGKISTKEAWKEFISETKRADEYRNQSFQEVYPEFSKIIGY